MASVLLFGATMLLTISCSKEHVHAPKVVVLAEIDPALVTKARSTVPSLENDRPFELKQRREAGE